ncbi:hypothetical protein DFQ27_009968, partial [Actinomortierella ambigua]
MDSGKTAQAVIEIGKFIGSGSYGEVFQGRYNTQKAAIKKFFRFHPNTTEEIETIEREINLLKRLQCRHIIQFYGVHRQGNEISLVTDFAEGGSLMQAINDSRVAGWHAKNRIAQEIAYGLAYIHHEGILHRDLKSDNVLLTRHMEVKLCDFGLAVIKTSSGGHSTERMRGTFRWLAPELVLSERPRYTTKSDMYALGMVMWEMAAMCTAPFKDVNNNFVVAQAVHGGRREQLPDDTPTYYRRWVELCWKQDPSERPNAINFEIEADALLAKPCTLSWLRTRKSQVEAAMVTVLLLMCLHALVFQKGHFQQTASECMETELGGTASPINLGIHLSNGCHFEQNDDGAATWLAKPADRLLAMAQNHIGNLYERGLYVEQNHVEAAKWYTWAASQGNTDAQNSLGAMYKDGRGVEQSDIEAVEWYTKAANQGNPDAQFNLGVMYKDGRGVAQSDVEAVKWFAKAANQENSNAQNNLGVMYKDGRGVEQSDVEAVK